MKKIIRKIYWVLRKQAPFSYVFKLLVDPIKTIFLIHLNSFKKDRKLEIGCSGFRIDGFETLSIMGSHRIDYVLDASKKLPFSDNSFDVIYASHVLEHVPWFQIQSTLKEWVRILKHDGILEIWVPNALLICESVINAETFNRSDAVELDNWYKFNPDHDPFVWANGRVFSYGDGDGSSISYNWHRSLFTPNSLKKNLKKAGLENICIMERTRVRGMDHGWINLGVEGKKP